MILGGIVDVLSLTVGAEVVRRAALPRLWRCVSVRVDFQAYAHVVVLAVLTPHYDLCVYGGASINHIIFIVEVDFATDKFVP